MVSVDQIWLFALLPHIPLTIKILRRTMDFSGIERESPDDATAVINEGLTESLSLHQGHEVNPLRNIAIGRQAK